MKHLREVRFMHKMWIGIDHIKREVANGFIDQRGNARYFDDVKPEVFIVGVRVDSHEILEDVNSQIKVLTAPWLQRAEEKAKAQARVFLEWSPGSSHNSA